MLYMSWVSILFQIQAVNYGVAHDGIWHRKGRVILDGRITGLSLFQGAIFRSRIQKGPLYVVFKLPQAERPTREGSPSRIRGPVSAAAGLKFG